MQNAPMTSPPSPDKVRLTVPVSPEVHETFQRLAKASGTSVGRAMGEWLADTLDAVEFMTTKVEQARSAPRQVAMELHAYALGAAEMTGSFLEEVRAKGRATGPARQSPQVPASDPPRPVIRGGNSGRKRT